MASVVGVEEERATSWGNASDAVAARFHPPAATLAELVIDYAIYESGAAGSQPRSNLYAPGPANVCMTFDAGPVSVRVRHWSHEWTNGSALFGPTSKAFTVASDGGRLIGFGLTALGWSRLTAQSAAGFANRVVPLAQVVGEHREQSLYAALAAARDDGAIVAALDAHLSDWLAPVSDTDAPLIRAMTALFLDPATDHVTTIADRLAITPRQVRRISGRYFGFAPKLLIRRTRFMRALMTLAEQDPLTTDFAVAPPGYHDQSHFIRDAQLFLDTTARRFLRDITPLMETMRVGRRARFGQPLQGLIAPGQDNRPASLDDTPPAA